MKNFFKNGGIYVYTHPNGFLHEGVPTVVLILATGTPSYGEHIVLDGTGKIYVRRLESLCRREL